VSVAAFVAAVLVAGATPAGAARRSAAACRAACRDRNVPASCAWLSPEPRRCVERALRGCEHATVPGIACPLPPDLPACGSNQGCPYGTLCIDATCQIVGCGSHGGVADCTGNNVCDGDKCVVAECNAVTANCARGFHCEAASGIFGSISGSCLPDDPGATYCASDTDCIAMGEFNPRCVDGVCARGRRMRRGARCTADGDCFRACLRSRSRVRVPLCSAAGVCVCADCTDGDQCNALFSCSGGQAEVCRRGTCVCPPIRTGGGDGFPTDLPPGNYSVTICVSGTVSLPCQYAGTIPFAGVAQFKAALLGAIDQWLAVTAGSDCARGAAVYSAFDGTSFTVTASATCGSASETVEIRVRLL
jgi:hypothetical protein